MTLPAALLDLAQLDDYRPVTLDPVVWSANLAALDEAAPDLAEGLRRVVLPKAWRPALALDGFVTYRLEEPGQPPAWLGDTAAPLIRARSLLAKFDPAGKNPGLTCCAAGAELHLLLQKLSAHLAVYVFETDLSVLAAVLAAQDFSAAIRQGRCILVPPGRETRFLAGLMETHPGLLPLAEILLPDLVPRKRVEELRAIGEHVNRETYRRRSQLVREISLATQAKPDRPLTEPRLAVLSLNPHPPTQAVAAALARAAGRLGWPVLHRAVTGPDSVDPLVHCQALADFEPNLTICVNHSRSRLPVAMPGITCVWLLDEPVTGAELPDDGTLYLAASPRVAAALRQANVHEQNVLDWYWACEPDAGQPPAAQADRIILLVADLPDLSSELYGITQAAHQKLWKQLQKIAAEVWETPRILEPAKLLVRAERECQVELTDAALRESIIPLIEQVVIPGVVLEHLARALAGEPATILALGRGWERAATGHLQPLATNLFELPDRGEGLRPLVCLFAGRRDPLGPVLLHAAARGWPLLVHSLGRQPLAPLLGAVLRSGQHFESFSDLSELRRALKSVQDVPAGGRRAERARCHVIENHSYERRLQDLLAHLRSGDSPRGDR
jgi:hypothetical protein